MNELPTTSELPVTLGAEPPPEQRNAPPPCERTCETCRECLPPSGSRVMCELRGWPYGRPDRRYCTNACRQRAYRLRRRIDELALAIIERANQAVPCHAHEPVYIPPPRTLQDAQASPQEPAGKRYGETQSGSGTSARSVPGRALARFRPPADATSPRLARSSSR